MNQTKPININIEIEPDKAYFEYRRIINDYFNSQRNGDTYNQNGLNGNFKEIDFFIDRIIANDPLQKQVFEETFNSLTILEKLPIELEKLVSDGFEKFYKSEFNIKIRVLVLITLLSNKFRGQVGKLDFRLSLALFVMVYYELHTFEYQLEEKINANVYWIKKYGNTFKPTKELEDAEFYQFHNGSFEPPKYHGLDTYLVVVKPYYAVRILQNDYISYTIYESDKNISDIYTLMSSNVISTFKLPIKYYKQFESIDALLLNTAIAFIEAFTDHKSSLSPESQNAYPQNLGFFNRFNPNVFYKEIDQWLFPKFEHSNTKQEITTFRNNIVRQLYRMLREEFQIKEKYPIQVITGLYASAMKLIVSKEEYFAERKKVGAKPDWNRFLKKKISDIVD